MSLDNCTGTSNCNEKTYEPFAPIDAKYVNWDKRETGSGSACYFEEVLDKMAQLNQGHNSFGYYSGTLNADYFKLTKETCVDKKAKLVFKISLKLNGANLDPLISPGFLVARPCPPFCDEGGFFRKLWLKFTGHKVKLLK